MLFPLLKKIPALHIASLIDVLEGLGIDRQEFLLRVNIDAAKITCREGQFELPHYLSVVQTALDISGCTDLGFRVGKYYATLDQGTLGYALLSSVTLRGSLSRYQRYQHMLGLSTPFVLTVEGDLARVIVAPSKQKILLSESLARYLTQAWLAGWNLWKLLIDEPGGFFEHVYLGYPENCDLDMYTSQLDCPVTFGHKQTMAVFPASYLERKLNFTAGTIDSICSAQLNRLDINTDIKSEGVTVDIHSSLANSPGRTPSMKEMSISLHVSPRTLRRKLLSEKNTYQQVVINFRMAKAMHYLRSTQLPANEIASLVGYADTANFYRTFRKNIGMLPSAYRRAG